MPSLKGKEYKRFEDIKHIAMMGVNTGVPELAPVLEYAKWDNFHKVISEQ